MSSYRYLVAATCFALGCSGPDDGATDAGSNPDMSDAARVSADAGDVSVDLSVAPDTGPTPPREDGQACADDADCIGDTCKTGEGFPDGYCTTDGCDGGCGPGSECSYSDTFGIFCAVTCAAQEDCRDGYACRTEGIPGDLHRLCTPIRGVPDGEPCQDRSDCQGGTCLPWPGGYCSTNRCETDDDCASLGGFQNKCVDDGAGGICLRACTDIAECRQGYLCDDIGLRDSFCVEDLARPFDDGVFAPSALDIQCGIPVENGEATIAYDIDRATTSYLITPMARDGQPLVPRRITLPDQTQKNFNLSRKFLTLSAETLHSMSPTLVPPGPDFTDMLAPGQQTFTVGAEGSEVCYYVVQKQTPGTTIDFNVYLVGVPGASAATAAMDADFGAVFAEVDRIFEQVGVSVGELRYFDVSADDATRYGVLRTEADVPEILKLSSPPGADLASLLSVNVFFLGQFVLPGAALGISAGLPGPAGLHGTHGSGVVFTSEYMGGPAEDTFGEPTDGNAYTAQIVAHEVGHWLGLRHTTEQGGQTHDHLADTGECANPNDSENCPDWGNLMFPFARGGNTALTADQGYVLQANPATH